jgi:hypothetical protein
MAVSQNIARLRALLQGLAVDNVKSMGLQLMQLESTESITGSAWKDRASNGGSSAVSTTTLISKVVTTDYSGSVTLAAGNTTGQLKYVILSASSAATSLTLSCSAATGGNSLTASITVPRTGIGLIYDGMDWNLLSPNSGSGLVGGTGGV